MNDVGVDLGGDSRGLGAILLAKLCHGQGGHLSGDMSTAAMATATGATAAASDFSFAAVAVAALASAERSFFLPTWHPVLPRLAFPSHMLELSLLAKPTTSVPLNGAIHCTNGWKLFRNSTSCPEIMRTAFLAGC